MSFEHENIDEYIRPPDQVVCEQLLPSSNVFTFPTPVRMNTPEPWCDDETLNRVLQESKLDFDTHTEKDVLDEYEEIIRLEKQQRETRFHNVKTQIHKIMKLDKNNAHIYTGLLNAFALFEDGYISRFYVENDIEYIAYMGILKTLRLSTNERNDLNQFICFVHSISE